MSRGIKIEVDGAKIKSILHAMGKTISDVSEEMGYGHAALGVKLNKDYLMNRDIVFLEKAYGIKPEVYLTNLPEEPAEEKPSTEPIDYERLFDLIYEATLKAMKKALED